MDVRATRSEEPGEDRMEADRIRLEELWRELRERPREEHWMVVCPSISMDPEEVERLGIGFEFEERLLCMLLRLRNPGARVIFLASVDPPPESLDHGLDLLMSAGVWDARDRLHVFSVGDPAPRPLAGKLAANPDLLRRVRQTIRRPDRAWLEVYRAGPDEERVARRLGIPMLGPPPSAWHLGTKSGARRLFRTVGLPCPEGVEGVRDEGDVVAALLEVSGRRPGLRRALVKLDDGFSGRGNAVLPLSEEVSRDPVALRRHLRRALRLQDPSVSYDRFLRSLARQGGVVEAMVEDVVASPSVQLFLSPDGQVEILSTHDQVLGGPDGQVYLGCRMPARRPYRMLLHEVGRALGQHLAAVGVLGNVGVDFVVGPPVRGEEVQAIEINLRKGGTTHPLYSLQFLTGGGYEPEAGEFLLPDGSPRRYQASDWLAVRSAPPRQALDLLGRRGLQFDPHEGRGVMLHMLGAVPGRSMLGATCVGTTPQDAADLFACVAPALRARAPRTRPSRPLPGPRERWSRRVGTLLQTGTG